MIGAGIGGLAAACALRAARLRGRGLRARGRARRGRRRTAARTERRQGAARARHRGAAAAAGLRADQHRFGGRRTTPICAFASRSRRSPRRNSARPISPPIAPTCTACCRRELPASSIHLDAQCTGAASLGGAAVATLCRRARDRGRYRGGRRRHQFGGARKPVRRAARPLHAADGVALHRADRLRADQDRARQIGRDRPRRICRLDRARRPRDLLSDPRRRALQHLRRPRVRAMGRGIVVGAEQRRRAACRLSRLERGAARHARPSRALLQMGHSRPRPAAALDARPRRRCSATRRIR